jgi:hypothetical protein
MRGRFPAYSPGQAGVSEPLSSIQHRIKNHKYLAKQTRNKKMSTSEFPPASIRPLVEEVAALLKERKETISVAETVRHQHPTLCRIYPLGINKG